MLLDLSRFRGTEDHLDRQYPPDAFGLEGEDFRVTAPVHFVTSVHKDGRKVRLVGRVTATIETACGRCLESFVVPVDTAFDVMYFPAGEPVGGRAAGGRTAPAHDADGEGGQEVAEDDLGVSFYRDDVIDLGELMREQFILAVPMKPLCKDECAGLCPVCGVNRNRESCSCQTEWIDPRMDALRRLTGRS